MDCTDTCRWDRFGRPPLLLHQHKVFRLSALCVGNSGGLDIGAAYCSVQTPSVPPRWRWARTVESPTQSTLNWYIQ